MSLKHFHVVFIIVAALLFAGVSLWSFMFSGDDSTEVMIMGASCAVIAVALVGYGIYFIRKARRIIT